MSFSSVGIGSGLKVDEMVAQLVALEKRPLAQLQTKAGTLNARVSAYSQLKSQISNLQDQVNKLTTAATWQGKTLTSANTAVVSGTASAKAGDGTFDVSVKHLATGQALGSAVVPAGTQLGTGTLTFTLGEWGEDGLVANTADGQPATVAVEITDQEDTLAKIAAKINQANAGVTATVLRDHTGERLSLQSNATGANAGFKVDVTQAEGAGLAQFAYGGPGGTDGMALSRAARDTEAEINGITMFSRNNTFTDVAEGVNLTVAKAEPDSTVRITIKGDTATAKSALKNLVDSYNALSGAMATMTAYDPGTKAAGTLQGDSTASNLQAALRRMLSGPGGGGGAFGTLSQIGLSFQKDGSLAIDDAKLDKALEDPDSMTKFFAADLPGTDQDGWAVRLKDFTTGLLSSDGVFATKDSSLKESLKRNTQDQERVNVRAQSVEKRLLAQYTRLDMAMANLSALDSYVSQQVTAWNNQKN